MKRTRITSRKLGTSNGNNFELTSLGVNEQKKNKLKRDHERQHKLILKCDEIKKANAKQAAINAIDYILATKQPSFSQKKQLC